MLIIEFQVDHSLEFKPSSVINEIERIVGAVRPIVIYTVRLKTFKLATLAVTSTGDGQIIALSCQLKSHHGPAHGRMDHRHMNGIQDPGIPGLFPLFAEICTREQQ